MLISCKKDDNVLFSIDLQQTIPTSLTEFQENILREIEKMEKISYETIRDFKYLDAVIKETMRSVSKLQFYSRYSRFLKLIPMKDSIPLYQ